MNLNDPVTAVKGVGAELAKKLAALGLQTVGDLIDYFPRRYNDFSTVTPVRQLTRPGAVTVAAKITQISGRYVRRRLHITEAVAADDSGSVRIVWFNQPYRAAAMKKGVDYFISGNFELSHQHFAIMNPSAELASEFPVSTARIVPIYRETKGLNSRQIRTSLKQLLPLIATLPETLPAWLIKEQCLLGRAEATRAIHFPETSQQLAAAQHRLGFEEVFSLSLAALMNKQELLHEHAPPVPFDEAIAKDFVNNLPFKLTDAQRKVVWQIYQDMQGKTLRHSGNPTGKAARLTTVSGAGAHFSSPMLTHRTSGTVPSASRGENAPSTQTQSLASSRSVSPMNRLVEGDVGSGKTVVAAMAAVMVLRSGHQAALMAPTELLARQHAATLHELLKPLGLQNTVGLLVGSLSAKQKQAARERIADGSIRFMVGTNALIQESVDMHRLELVIIDEQHRFGVDQRKALMQKAGHMPHVLSLTATPIPRSLALTLYGDLDVSILADKPPGRQPILTEIVSPNSRAQLYKKIDKELEAGRQMFVVCPLITESAMLAVSSAEKIYEQLSKRDFKHRRVGLLHGRMKAADKNAVMQDFIEHKLDILVSTTVIEVGVDVPNASIMLIEAADRFGLAQIHQLRGRVGRGEHQGYCYLLMSDSSAPGPRLGALERSNDGFKLAELDLRLRGPGAIYGQAQHGQLDLRIAQLTDVKLIAEARQAAQKFLDSGEGLGNYKILEDRILRLSAVTNLN